MAMYYFGNIDHISSRLRTSKPVINRTVVFLQTNEDFATPSWVKKDKRYCFTLGNSIVGNIASIVQIYVRSYHVIWETSGKKGSIQTNRIRKIESLDPVGEMVTIHRVGGELNIIANTLWEKVFCHN